MSITLKIGSRQSPLAKVQVQEILASLGKIPFSYETVFVSTKGDIDKTSSLMTNGIDDFFTDTLDQALINNEIDIAIHSAKDLPKRLNEKLKIFALTKTMDDTDSWLSDYSLEDLPQGAKVGTSSPLRAKSIKNLRPDVTLIDIRGTIAERIELLKNKKIDGLIVATCALKRLGLSNYIKSVLPWEGTPLQGQLAIVGRKSDWAIAKLFESIDVRKTFGKVVLVGAGPGDPQLITLKAIDALRRADCVFYDYLADPSLLKHAPQAEHLYVGKRKGEHSLSQHLLCQQLKEKAFLGKNVVRLKGGDPLIFGRGAEEIEYLSSYHIQVDVIPGVSSATGIPAILGVPLTARNVSSSVAFVSGYNGEDEKTAQEPLKIPKADTIVFLMGLTKLKQIIAGLIAIGWSKTKPIMIVSHGTKVNQQIIKGTLEDIEHKVFEGGIEAPALIIAGDVTNFYKTSDRKQLLHCGTHPERYSYLGDIISWPTIEIKPVEYTQLQKEQLVKDFDQSDFVILTSPNAVEHFITLILTLKSAVNIKQKVFAVIGKSSAQVMEDYGLSAQLISSVETAQGLYGLISKLLSLDGKHILLPRSNLPNPFLKEALISKGAQVSEWTIYQNVKLPKRNLPNKHIDGVIFTSPSTFHNFIEDYGTIPSSWELYAKGPVTAKAMSEAGYKPHVENI